MKLNLGCGRERLAGWTNHDLAPDRCGADLYFDLRDARWPLPAGSCSEVRAHMVLEHLQDPVSAFCEIHRLLRPGGLVDVTVPHYRAPWNFCLDHRRSFSRLSFLQLDAPEAFGQHLALGRFSTQRLGLEFPFLPVLVRAPLEALLARRRWAAAWEWLGFPTAVIHWIGRKEP